MKNYFTLIFFFCAIIGHAQYAVDGIPESLTKDANAVIRYQETTITLNDFDSMTTYTKMVVTVLNRDGMVAVSPVAFYDEDSSIKEIKAFVYDSDGKQIKKFKKKDFTDMSASGGDLYSDDRMMSMDYIPARVPYTLEFISETKSKSTAFLPLWNPSPIYGVSTQKSVYKIINEKEVPLLSKKYNLEQFNATIKERPALYTYEIENVPAVSREYLSPHYTEFTPVVKIALKKFRLFGQYVSVSSWEDFGNWQNEYLLKDIDELPKETIAKIESLVAGVDDLKEKTRIIYEYMQNKTRYISVQVGIGGWKPTPAKEIDKLGYGDCKALLKSQGIDSYYTIVNSGSSGLDIDEEFVAIQGNHVILTVPLVDENLFLECTSQRIPFNYIGDFTDDRKVLMIKETGGVIEKTPSYATEENTQKLEAQLILKADQSISGKLNEVSQGVLYGDKYELETKEEKIVVKYYKELWSHLNNLDVAETFFVNDKRNIVFSEKITFDAANYTSQAGDRLLFVPNIFNRLNYIPSPKKERLQGVELRRGKTYSDVIQITLPEGYDVEAVFDPISITTEFGTYLAKIDVLNSSKITYTRDFVLNNGVYEKEKYVDFVAFVNAITKADVSKIVLVKNK
ncbi:MAG: hypothetical protein ACI849_000771 [Patiriisocius sp.]|jgi:hypothetical protein